MCYAQAAALSKLQGAMFDEGEIPAVMANASLELSCSGRRGHTDLGIFRSLDKGEGGIRCILPRWRLLSCRPLEAEGI